MNEDTPLRYIVVRSARRRRTFALTVERDGTVRVAAPMRARAEEIRRFVERHRRWIASRLAARPPDRAPLQFASGECIPYLGRPLRLLVEPGAATRPLVARREGALFVIEPASLGGDERRRMLSAAIERWYRAEAATRLSSHVARWGVVMGVEPRAVRVRDQRRRWGSCGADGTLRFNWRLVMAPADVIDYVVVHELAHLRVLDHSPAFWEEVGRILPDYRALRAKLNAIGPSLTMEFAVAPTEGAG